MIFKKKCAWAPVLLLSLFFGGALFAQTQPASASETAIRYVQANSSKFGLSAEDVADLRVSDAYVTRHNGLAHVWLQQQYHGIPVFNALMGVHVSADGKVYTNGHRFTSGLSGKINTSLPSLSASQALQMAMLNLSYAGFTVPSVREKSNEQNWLFEGGAVSEKPIPVKAVYQPVAGGALHLAWMIVIDDATTSDVWSMSVDAQSGEIIRKDNRTVYCALPDEAASSLDCVEMSEVSVLNEEVVPVNADASYRVFALPIESPAHGNRSLVVDPADPQASPFGWHDTDGATGAEYTYTRGNNVWAYNDLAGDNNGSAAESAEGGAALNFDFPFDINNEPIDNKDAAVSNLFYVNNRIHDITYRYGFDEPAGNFQIKNYSNQGLANDAVRAEALDASGENNANFATFEDGVPGRMQMYAWTRPVQLTVNTPIDLAGNYYAAPASGWGGAIDNVGVTGDAVVIDDGSSEATFGCSAAINDLNGKIALIDRGNCQFGQKALNAQEAGAKACIICNFEDAYIGMSAGNFGGQVTIPVIMITRTRCDLMKQKINEGLNVTIALPNDNGPNYTDGDFDNGIVAHEYTHGISNRLTGGPNNPDCLGNAEQMGEGWSDILALITTTKPGSTGDQKRGVGTFVYRQPNDGEGIRRFPYSSDLSINPLSYSDVAYNPEVHALGEVWTAMTWDLYWAMVEKYGFDPDLNNTSSGNGRALQLILDGMKLQPCNPGFVDGRDAILLADKINYNGADTCLISAVFARRGLGYFADQGSSFQAGDGKQNFDPIPTCVKELKIKKITNTPTLTPGETAEFVVTVTNHKDEAVTNVVVQDELPAGLTFVTASNGGNESNGVVIWNLGTLASGQVVTLQYTASTKPEEGSISMFHDLLEDDFTWLANTSISNGSLMYPDDQDVKAGQVSWRADDPEIETDMTLEYVNSLVVSGDKPVLRFWTKYNTEPAADAGFVEIREVNENVWHRFGKDKSFRNGYSNFVQYGTFAIPFMYGFSGNSDGWQQSYLDLSDYTGKEVFLRFRFGSDDNTGGDAWLVDDVEMLDMLNYEGEACVSSAEGDLACSALAEAGVIMNVGIVPTQEASNKQAFELSVQPNPASDMVYVRFGADLPGKSDLSLISVDGRKLYSAQSNGLYKDQTLGIDVQQLPVGVYTLRVENALGSSWVRVVIR